MSQRPYDRLWLNANLATMRGPEYGAIPDGALGIKDGRIAWVGARSALPARPRDLSHDVIDARGAWMTPGLIDSHTHLVYGGSRAREFELRLTGVAYDEIARQGGGILSTVRATRALDEDELVAVSLPRAKALAAEGVTTIEIKSGYGLTLEDELKTLRAARRLEKALPLTVTTTLLAAHALPPEFAGRADAYIDYICDVILPAAANLADAVDVFCESIGFSPAQCERVFKAARSLRLPIKGHMEQLSNLGGSALAARFGALSVDHLEYLDAAGIAALREAGTTAVLLPGAFYFLREKQLPPVDALRAAGVPMAIATDLNPGTSPFASIRLMLNMACTLFRLTPEEALAGVTRNAARALGRSDSIGTLEVGKWADLALWTIDHPAELAYQVGVECLRESVHRGTTRHVRP